MDGVVAGPAAPEPAAAAEAQVQDVAQAPATPAFPSVSQYRDRDDLPDMAGYRLLHTLPGHDSDVGGGGSVAVTSVRFDREGQRLASASTSKVAKIWVAETGKLLHALKGHTAGISDVAWAPDGRYLATASDDGTLRVWDATTGGCVRNLPGHSHYVSCCAFSPGSNLLVSGGFDEVVIVWDVRHARPIKIIPGHSDPVTGVDFCKDPTTEELSIVSCSFDGLTRVWHAGTGRCLSSLTDKDQPALSCARFTPNGQYVLTCTLDSRLLLWDPKARKVKKTYNGHLNQHSCCQATFMTHGGPQARRHVACGSEDHHIYLWDLQTKQIAGLLRGRPSSDAPGDGHCAPVLTVDAALGRPLIASGGHAGDGTVKIWQGPTGAGEQPATMET